MTSDKSRNSLEEILSAISLKSLVSGFRDYRARFALVMKQRGRYFRDTAQAEENLVRSSVATYLYGIALTFLLYLPFILKHGLGIGKIYFLLEFIYLQGLLVLLITLSVKSFAVVAH